MIRVKNVSAYLDESFILRMRVVPRSEQISSSLFGDGDFLCNRKLRSYYINPHREDAHLRLDVNYLHRIDGFLHQRIDLLGKLSLIIVNHV